MPSREKMKPVKQVLAELVILCLSVTLFCIAYPAESFEAGISWFEYFGPKPDSVIPDGSLPMLFGTKAAAVALVLSVFVAKRGTVSTCFRVVGWTIVVTFCYLVVLRLVGFMPLHSEYGP